MTVIAKSAAAHYDASTAMFAPQISGDLEAGEDIFSAATPCYIDVDGKVYRAVGAAADKKAVIAGFSNRAALRGQQITLYSLGTRFQYGSNLTPGTLLFLGVAAGTLEDTATTGGAIACAQVIDTTDIRIIRAF